MATPRAESVDTTWIVPLLFRMNGLSQLSTPVCWPRPLTSIRPWFVRSDDQLPEKNPSATPLCTFTAATCLPRPSAA